MNPTHSGGRRSHSFDRNRIGQQLEQLDKYFDTLDDETSPDGKPPAGAAPSTSASARVRRKPRLSDATLYLEADDTSAAAHQSRRYSGALEKILVSGQSSPEPAAMGLPKLAKQKSRRREGDRKSRDPDWIGAGERQQPAETEGGHRERKDGRALSYHPQRRTKSSSALGRSRREERMERQGSARAGIVNEAHKKPEVKEAGPMSEDLGPGIQASRSFRTRRNVHHSPGRLSPHRRKDRGPSRLNSTPFVHLEAGFGVADTPTLPSTEEELATKPTLHRSHSGHSLRNHRRVDASSPRRVDGSNHRRQGERQTKRLSISLSPTSTGSRRWRQLETMAD
jgi:hypothetical protein